MIKSRKNLLAYLFITAFFLIATVLFMLPTKRAHAEEVSTPYYVTNNTKNVTVGIDYYNDCYKDLTDGYYGYTAANSIVYVDRTAVTDGAFLVQNSRGATLKVVAVNADGIATAAITPTNEDESDYTVTIPENGYILVAKGTAHKETLSQIETNDQMSALQVADGVKIATNETLKQSIAIEGVNQLIDNKTTVYTEGSFSISASKRYRVITAVYKDSKFVVVSNRLHYESASTSLIVPQGGIMIVSSGTSYLQNDHVNCAYAQPFMQKAVAGDVISLDYEPENVGRYIIDKTTNTIIPIHFYNDYFKDGYTPGHAIVCVDRKAFPNGEFNLAYNRGTYTKALVVTGDGNGNYTAGAPYTPGAAAQTITIPEDGYVLLAKSAATEQLHINAVTSGDEMSGICMSKQPEDTLVLRTNNGYYVLDVSGKINEDKGSVSVYTNTTVTGLQVNLDRYVLANYDALSGCYIVSESAYATSEQKTVLENQILIVSDATTAKTFYYAKPALSANSEVAVGTVVEYAGYQPEVKSDVKVNGIAVDGINPALFLDEMTIGKTIIYTSTEMRERNDTFGSEVNKSYRVTTFARPSESNVRNYLVKMIAQGVGYKHVVTQIVDSKDAVQIPYDGYVISVPETKIELYNLFEVGDEITLSGEDSEFRVPFYVIDNKTKNVRMEINDINVASPTYSNWIMLYDSSFGETDPVKAYRYRKVITNGVITSENTAYGTSAVGVAIPQNGFVLTANGLNTGVAQLSSFAINDEVVFYNVKENTDATLSSIKVNGEKFEEFTANRTKYYLYFEQGSAVPTFSYTPSNANATVEVLNTPTAIPGAYEVKVTAVDGVTEKVYTFGLYPNLEKDTTLSKVLVNGQEWKDFAPSKEYCNYYIVKGSALPTFSATATDSNAKVSVTQATAGNLTAVIQVVAQDEGFTKNYRIVVVEVDLSLVELKVGDSVLPLTGENSFTMTIAKGTEYYPIVQATATDKTAQVTITQANAGTKKAVVEVFNYGLSVQYTINFVLESNAPTTQPIDDSGCNGNISMIGLLPLACLVVAAVRRKYEE